MLLINDFLSVSVIVISLGIVLSILSLAKLLDYSLNEYPEHTWAYFFGLVLASVYYVGQKIKFWNWKIITTLALGTLIAFIISFISYNFTWSQRKTVCTLSPLLALLIYFFFTTTINGNNIYI